MKKIFNKIAILLTASIVASPLTACTFNLYRKSAFNAAIQSFANQTSSVVKSLILSKEKNTDTSQTIEDILKNFSNPSIKNHTSSTSLNTWQDFESQWGFNQKINISGFDTQDYFVASDQGTLTKEVNKYNNMNDIFNKLNYVLAISVVTNRTIYDLFKNNNDVKNTIINILNQSKKTNPDDFPADLKTILTLLKNIVLGKDWKNPNQNTFNKNIIEPLNSLLTYLVDGQWSDTQVKSPINSEELKNFMTNWKDKDGDFYSNWHDGTNWKLDEKYYKNWNQNDYEFLRGGAILNYLFFKISKEYKIENLSKTDESKPRYLGDIITQHITELIGGETEPLLADIKQYLPYLLENPKYLLLIIEAITPIIKQWALNMNNISLGVKNLTFGQGIPTDDTINSYNMLDVLNNINYILNNPDQLEIIINNLLGITGDNENAIGKSFTYDIKVKILFIEKPLGDALSMVSGLVKELVNTLKNAITDNVTKVFQTVINIYQQWVKQYDDIDQGINFDLKKLKEFLLNDQNGLITLINKDIIPVLYNIMKEEKPLDDQQYFEFYQSLGGQLPINPNEEPPLNFKSNSVLSIIKDNISNIEKPLGQIIYILLGNTAKDKQGIFTFIGESNKQWINDNYTSFFDINNEKQGKVHNISMTTENNNNIFCNSLIYNFDYQINNRTYSFLIKCKALTNQDIYTGIKEFYFTDIELKNIH